MSKKPSSGNLESLLGGSFKVDEVVPDVEVLPSAADSEWTQAAPAPHILEQRTGEAESLTAIVHPTVEARQNLDEALIQSYKDRAQPYEQISGRFDPFADSRIVDLVAGQHYSTFLKRPIITLKDALDHSIQLCLFWAEEDGALNLKPPVVNEEEQPQATVGTRAQRVEELRVAWRHAVAEAKRIKAEQEAIVAKARLAYQLEKQRDK